MSGASDTLQSHRDRPCRTDLNHQVHASDIDTEFERSSRYNRAQLSRLQSHLGFESKCSRQAAVMWQYDVVSQPRAERMRHPLRHPARVHKHQRRLVIRYVARNAIVDLIPHLASGHSSQLIVRDLYKQFEIPPMSGIYDRRAGSEIIRNLLDRPHRRGQPDSLGVLPINAFKRASVRARCEPRLSSAIAWISSTITVRALRSISRDLPAVTRINSDSGVVTRM